MLGLSELLQTRGLVPDPRRVKVVRHKDSRVDLEGLRSAGWFDLYQKYQAKPVFDGCDYVVAFMGEERSAARFFGVYDVGKRLRSQTHCRYPRRARIRNGRPPGSTIR